MNLTEHIAQAKPFEPRTTLTFAAAAKVPDRARPAFSVQLLKRLAEAQNKIKAEDKPATRNPSLLCS